MSQKTALLVATALTVFMLMVMVGVMWQVFQKSTVDVQALQATAPAPVNVVANAAQPVNEPAPQEQVAQREAAFRDLIEQANQKLEQSYKQQQELSKQIQAMQLTQKPSAPVQPQASQQPKYQVTPDQAVSIALTAVPGAVLVHPAELISFQDNPAYEVTLDKGVVYVHANTGQVLYNSAAVIIVRSGGGGGNNNSNPSPAVTNNQSGGHKEDHEDENHEDEHEETEHKESEREDHK